MSTTKSPATGTYNWNLDTEFREANQIDLHIDRIPDEAGLFAVLQGQARIAGPVFTRENLVLVFPVHPDGSFNGTVSIGPNSARVYYMRGLDDVNNPVSGTAGGGQVDIKLDTEGNLSGSITGFFPTALSITSSFDVQQPSRKLLTEELKAVLKAFKQH